VIRKYLPGRVESNQRLALTAVALFVAVGIGLTFFQASGADDDSSEFNRNDVMFMNMMVVHHEQAIEMAELSQNRTNNRNILELSENISEAQSRENRQMRKWMNSLGYETGNHHRMAGMATQSEMQRLEGSNGSDFDRLFAELMIEHHRGGIEMARNFRRNGQHTELRQMQTQMIETQQREIQKMQKWQNQGF